MDRRYWLAGIAIVSDAAAAQTEPQPKVGPAPLWVVKTAVPAPSTSDPQAPFRTLLSASQTRFFPDRVESYLEYSVMPQTTGGLQAVGTIMLPWNVERSDLTIHRVEIRRAGKTIDLLQKPEFTILRRESNLEQAVLDGIRTIVLPASGLQVGDALTVAATYSMKPQSVGQVPEDLQLWTASVPVQRYERRFFVPEGMTVRSAVGQGIPKPTVARKNGGTEFVFAADNLKIDRVPANAPARFKIPLIQFSAYRDWGQVADQLRPLFATARILGADSGLRAEADRIAAQSPDQNKRMLAALRLAQEQIRYVALTLGEGAYVPATADQTWARKFGDCKGKTALLLALLDRLGIAAEPVLASVGNDDGLNDRLPSLALFDHVFVRAEVDGRTYYLDATNYGQRSLEELARAPVKWALPLVAGATIDRLNRPAPSQPVRETEILWDASNGFGDKVPFTAKLVMRDGAASLTRAFLAATTDQEQFDTQLKAAVPEIANDDLTIVEKIPEGPDGSFIVRFSGKAAMDWTPVEGKSGQRYQFNHDTILWRSDFQRSEGPWKDLPVAVNFGDWQRGTETVILPNQGKGFTLEASAIDERFGGAELKRSVRRDGDRVTLVSSYRVISDEISAAEARAATEARNATNDNFAYVVAPDGYLMTRNERKALLDSDGGSFEELMRRGALRFHEGSMRAAIADFDRAAALNPDSAVPHAAKVSALLSLNKVAEARASLVKAQALDPKAEGLAEARSRIAWLDYDLDTAIRAINEAIEASPDNVQRLTTRAHLLAGAGRTVEAMADARKVHRLSDGKEGADLIARLQSLSGNDEAALGTLDAALAEQPKYPGQLLVLKGDALMRIGRQAEAGDAYAKAATAFGSNMVALAEAQGIEISDSASINTTVLLFTRQFEKAEAAVAKVMAGRRFASASHHADRGYYRLRQGKLNDAAADAKEALEIEPDNSRARTTLAFATLRQGRAAEAEQHFGKAIAARPTEATLFYGRAVARSRLGKTALADQDLKVARGLQFDVEIDPAVTGLKTDS